MACERCHPEKRTHCKVGAELARDVQDAFSRMVHNTAVTREVSPRLQHRYQLTTRKYRDHVFGAPGR